MAKLKITPLNQFVKGVFHFYDIFFHIFPDMDTFYASIWIAPCIVSLAK